jgi:hypothetical protein
MKPIGENNSKKAYQKPALKIYGDIGAITGTVFNTPSANADHGSGGMNKTH